MTWEVASGEDQGLRIALREERRAPRVAHPERSSERYLCLFYCMQVGGASVEHLLCALGATYP